VSSGRLNVTVIESTAADAAAIVVFQDTHASRSGDDS